MKQNTNLKKLSVTAMLCALAYICMFVFKFNVSFLTFDFKDAVLTVIAFLYGPVYGVVSSCLVAFIEFLSVSDTGVYGLVMNALSSAVFTATCGIIYKDRRTLTGAVFGSIAAVLSMTAVMLVANMFITPYYMGVARADVVAMIPTLLLPFNLVKAILNAAIVLLLYKPLSKLLKRIGFLYSAQSVPQEDGKQEKSRMRSALITIIALLVIAGSLAIIFFVLKK